MFSINCVRQMLFERPVVSYQRSLEADFTVCVWNKYICAICIYDYIQLGTLAWSFKVSALVLQVLPTEACGIM